MDGVRARLAFPLPKPHVSGAEPAHGSARAPTALGTASAGHRASSSRPLTHSGARHRRGDRKLVWLGNPHISPQKPSRQRGRSPSAEAPRGGEGPPRPARDTCVGTPRCQTARYVPPLGNSSSPSPSNIPSLSAPRYSVPVGSV